MALKAYEDACLRAELFGQPKPDKDEFLDMHKHLDVVEFDEVDIKIAENTAMLSEDLKAANGGVTELNTILNSTQTKLNRLKELKGEEGRIGERSTCALLHSQRQFPVFYCTKSSCDRDGWPCSELRKPDTAVNDTLQIMRGCVRFEMLLFFSTKIVRSKRSYGVVFSKLGAAVRSGGVCGSLTNFFRGKFSGQNLSYSTGPSYIGHTNYDKDYVVANANADSAFTGPSGGAGADATIPRSDPGKNCGDINSALNDLKTMQDNENTALINKNKTKDIGDQVNSQISKLDKLINQADRAQGALQSQNKQMKWMLR
ncbi:hypothetical protein EVAR_70127_1 [Eumeta japonica]|uniref:t-SNARE coiled-coil homology domain-containing protein n=1 Tax=Eumeta variegata TaxID=151549 RepID=A0A4C1Z7I8_EUMVA|nr:hypothetical protein EVAR_70127_1 [Eumeta japonica]